MTTNVFDRGKILVAQAAVGPSNMGAGNGFSFKLPSGATLLRLTPLTVTAFDSETTATLTIGDGTTTFVNAVDIKSTGSETVASVPKHYPNGGTVSVTAAQTGAAATAGLVVVVAEYTQLGLGGEIQG